MTMRVTQRLTKGVKDEREINLLNVSMIRERSTEDVKRGVCASLLHYPDFCQQLLKNYGFFESVWPVYGLKIVIRPSELEVAVLATQPRYLMQKKSCHHGA